MKNSWTNRQRTNGSNTRVLKVNEPRNDGFEDRSALVMKHVNLVEDYEFHELSIRSLSAFSGHYVPLFGCAHENLSCDYLVAL